LQGLCIVRFGGASSGNPGPAGAGVVMFAEDGRKVSNICNNSIGFYFLLLIKKIL